MLIERHKYLKSNIIAHSTLRATSLLIERHKYHKYLLIERRKYLCIILGTRMGVRELGRVYRVCLQGSFADSETYSSCTEIQGSFAEMEVRFAEMEDCTLAFQIAYTGLICRNNRLICAHTVTGLIRRNTELICENI